jgi:hypothetical protein
MINFTLSKSASLVAPHNWSTIDLAERLLLAQSGPPSTLNQCLLFGVKRTWVAYPRSSAILDGNGQKPM